MLVEILVDGIVKLTVPASIRTNGTIWSVGKPPKPVINGALAESRGISRETIAGQVKSNNYSPDVLACGMVLGENFGGRIARDKDAARDQARQRREAAMTPVEREKRTLLDEISRIKNQARRCDRSEGDVEFRQLTWDAENMQAEFYARFPEEVAATQAARLHERAENARRIADGAMLYDCDGTLSYEDQCERRDEGYAKAAALEAHL